MQGPDPSARTKLLLTIVPVVLSAFLIYRISTSQKRGRSDSSDWGAGAERRAKWTDDEYEASIWEVGGSSDEEEDHEDKDDESTTSESRRPHEYFCMFRPFFDVQNENAAKNEEDQLNEDHLLYRYNEAAKADDSIEKPAAEHPDHQWVAMWETWKLFSTWERRASYTNPEFFGMHISRHFHGYGMQEMVENMLITFDKEFGKKKRTKKSIKQMWAIVAAMMQWLMEIPQQPWITMSDAKKLETTVGLIGRALVAVLNEIDRAKMLKGSSDIKDLGLVVSFYIYWADSLKSHGQNFEVPYRKEAVAYAKKAGVDLNAAGCFGTEEKVKALEKEVGRIKSLSGSPRSDRWEWRRKFKKFSKENKIGGEKYNILRMSRTQRASFTVDKKDPLADVSDKALQEGNVRVRPRRGGV
ncbi:hypothetical protein F5Y04DRAFT_192299 [Hypomontagnella monticulosa]|nr:hypothetical protein F5Y04DRAFT_192299 [Hypomontagnella monticulosa]